MSKVYKVSDDGQLIEHLTAEAVKSIAREQLSNAPRNSEITLEEAKSLIAASEADDCQHICLSFDEARSFAKALREMRAARDAEQDEPAALYVCGWVGSLHRQPAAMHIPAARPH